MNTSRTPTTITGAFWVEISLSLISDMGGARSGLTWGGPPQTKTLRFRVSRPYQVGLRYARCMDFGITSEIEGSRPSGLHPTTFSDLKVLKTHPAEWRLVKHNFPGCVRSV